MIYTFSLSSDHFYYSNFQFSHSVVSDSLQHCGYSMPGFPVQHQLPELAQTHIHQVGDAIQPSHPLSSPVLQPSFFPSIRIFPNESFLHIRWPKNWNFSFSISPSERVTGRKARGLQMEEIGCKWQTVFSLLSGRRKQTGNIFFSFSIQI